MKVKYISESEIDGEVSNKLLKTASRFIGLIGSYFNINCMASGTHGKTSAHYDKPCNALDGYSGKHVDGRNPTKDDMEVVSENLSKLIAKDDKTVYEESILAYLAGFTGIGIYPDWRPKESLHLDVGASLPVRPRPKVWIGKNKEKMQKLIDKTKGSQIYIYLN